MAKRKRVQIDDPTIRELDGIKRLLILVLLKSGTPQAEIAKALGIDAGTLSKMVPAREFKPWRAGGAV